MAEQFKKTYISVHEFITSWEKEVYELTNLDYFIFLLINEVAGKIESEYIPRINNTNLLHLHSEEIGTLAFNLGDNLQQFFEDYCFGSCPLKCPVKLKDPLTAKDQLQRNNVLSGAPLQENSANTKESCFHTDILEFVIIETLIEFYHFEKGFMIDEKDEVIKGFSEFIISVFLESIYKDKQKLLQQSEENASEHFNRLLHAEGSNWQEEVDFSADEDFDLQEGEEWKLAQSGLVKALNDFSDFYFVQHPEPQNEFLLKRFSEFLTDFLQISRVEELSFAEIKEFFTVIVVHELLAEQKVTLSLAAELFFKLLKFLDYKHNCDLSKFFEQFVKDEYQELQRTFAIVSNYSGNFPLVNYLLSEDANNPSMLDGFFAISEIKEDGLKLEDIHLKTVHDSVSVKQLDTQQLKIGDVLHMQMVEDGNGFRLGHLEMIYPKFARNYLY